MTILSVNINKVATLRNARGGNVPDVLLAAQRAQEYGAQGITVHPRPDERHITYRDTLQLRPIVTTEYNIEGNPTPKHMELLLSVRPEQATLVPDAPDVLTSNAGWDTVANADFLKNTINRLKEHDIRVSIFVNPIVAMVEGAAACGSDRVELYTEAYAAGYQKNREQAIAPYVEAAKKARELGLMVNAGHDLNAQNLAYFIARIPWLAEVSIGHAIIADSLYWGLEPTIHKYLEAIQQGEAEASNAH
jgi:pyridoxine 5'-phosphate synthase